MPGIPGGASADGSTVVTGSHERLTPDDLDHRSDLFVTRGGVTRRITGDGPVDTPCWIPQQYCAGFRYVSDDGSRVFFETTERLVAADTDDRHDVYQWAGGITTLLSPARPGNGADKDVTFVDGALDGSIVYVESEEPLTADDTNTRLDAYRVHPPPPGEVEPPIGGGGAPPPVSGVTNAGAASQQAGVTNGGAASQEPSVRLRLRGRPRTLRLLRGTTRLVRAGRGVPFSLSRRSVMRVTLERLSGGRRGRAVVLRLRASAGRHVLRLAKRLPGGRRLRPGRYRITLAVTDAVALTVRLRAQR